MTESTTVRRTRSRNRNPLEIIVARTPPRPNKVLDTFWRFACERQAIFFRRLNGTPPPWTDDPILDTYRFTNAYRASDRVSQYLIRHVQYRPDLPAEPRELLFRTLLFKLFNRVDTWQLLESQLGPLTRSDFSFAKAAGVLARAAAQGQRLYSPAYIMPSTGVLGEQVKHRGHLRLVEMMTQPTAVAQIHRSKSLRELFESLLAFPTLGPFLAFQLAIDLNYSTVVDHSEMEFVVAGPGAIDGLRKCFDSLGGFDEADTIRWVAERQAEDTARLGLVFPTLFGRSLQLIDVQNLFCEVSKYARVAHPEVPGINGRTRIKQILRIDPRPQKLFFPPSWGINPRIPDTLLSTNPIPARSDAPHLFAH